MGDHTIWKVSVSVAEDRGNHTPVCNDFPLEETSITFAQISLGRVSQVITHNFKRQGSVILRVAHVGMIIPPSLNFVSMIFLPLLIHPCP